MLAELAMILSAPACTAALNGSKYFSRSIAGEMYAGVRSFPLHGAPYAM